MAYSTHTYPANAVSYASPAYDCPQPESIGPLDELRARIENTSGRINVAVSELHNISDRLFGGALTGAGCGQTSPAPSGLVPTLHERTRVLEDEVAMLEGAVKRLRAGL